MSVVAETIAVFLGADSLAATSIIGAQLLRRAPQAARATAEPAPVALAPIPAASPDLEPIGRAS